MTATSYAQSDKQLLGLLKTRYKKEHRYVIQKYSKRRKFNVGRKSRRRYQRLSNLYSKIAKRLLLRAKRRRSRKILKQAQMFSRLSAYVTPRNRSSYRVAKTVSQAKKANLDQQYQSNFFAFFSYYTWQDELLFTSASTGEFTMLNTAEAMALGLGWNYQNAKYNFFVDGSFTIFSKGQASVLENNTVGPLSITWAPKREMTSVVAGPGILFKTLSEDLDIGFQGFVFYRSGDWTNVPSGGGGSAFTTEDNTLLTGGLSLVMKWNIADLAFISKYGKIFGAKSSFFALNTAYEF